MYAWTSPPGVCTVDHSRIPGALERVEPIPMIRQIEGLEHLDVDPRSLRIEHGAREAQVRGPASGDKPPMPEATRPPPLQS